MVTYAESGVDRDLRKEAKKSLRGLRSTFVHSAHGEIIDTPFNTLYPISENVLQVKTSDGVGSKVLLAEMANKHDTIGIDAVAMVVNDCIRCGARPIAMTDTIDVRKSTPRLLDDIQKGLVAGANESECPIVGGETADVPELVSAPYQINCDCVGEVERDKVIDGKKIKIGDVIIGMRSSGAHSNGISLLRKTLFSKWGGKYDAFDVPDGFDREIVFEALEPTRIYVKQFLKTAKNIDVLGAVHITGDAYLKFKNLTSLGFGFDNFKPHPIFDLIQSCGVAMNEMFRTFNMGWGFAMIVRKQDADDALQQIKGEVIGRIVERGTRISFLGRDITLE